METTWRVIFDGAHPGAYNMALDEALYLEYTRQHVPTLRIYQWKPACFSVGYSQDPDDFIDCALACENGIDIVRRITGGGVIYHSDELTYSIVCSTDDIPLTGRVKESYRILNSFLLRFYERLGLEAGFASDGGRQVQQEKSFLCGAAREPLDILVNGRKIGGNAQRRARKNILQQGSIPLTLDWPAIFRYLRMKNQPERPLSGALSDYMDDVPYFDALSSLLAQQFAAQLGITLLGGRLSEFERRRTDELLNKRKHFDIMVKRNTACKKCGLIRK